MALVLRTTLRFESMLGDDEQRESLHVFLTHGLSGAHATVVTHDELQQSSSAAGGGTLTVDIPFDPHTARRLAAAEQRHWTPHIAGGSDEAAAAENAIPPSASLGINGYVETHTEGKLEARERAGEAVLLLSDLEQLYDGGGGGGGGGGLQLAMVQNTGSIDLIKGVVSVTGAHIHDTATGAASRLSDHVQLDVRPHAVRASLFHTSDLHPDVAQHAARTLRGLEVAVSHSLDVFFPVSEDEPRSQQLRVSANRAEPLLLPSAQPAYLQRMHCPYYKTAVGLIPGSAFALRVPRQLHSDSYWTTALTVALRRHDVSASSVLDGLQAQDQNSAAASGGVRYAQSVLGAMLSTQANSFVYLDDKVDMGGATMAVAATRHRDPEASRRDDDEGVQLVRARALLQEGAPTVSVVEDYKNSALFRAGDCEDLAKTVLTDAVQFSRHFAAAASAFSRAGPPDAVQDDVRALLQQLHHVFFASNALLTPLVLGGVSNKNLQEGVRFMRPEDANAHTYAVLMPTARYLDALPLPGAHAGADAHRASAFARSYVRAPWHEQLDVAVCEGTARASSALLPLSFYYGGGSALKAASERQRRRVELQRSFARALPDGAMQRMSTEILNKAAADTDGGVRGDIARDRANVSNFYNAVSAMYVREFADTGYNDVAVATANDDGLTHGSSFTAFALPRWPVSMRMLPYNPLSPSTALHTADALEALEPLHAVRRDGAAAVQQLPAALQPYAAAAAESSTAQPASCVSPVRAEASVRPTATAPSASLVSKRAVTMSVANR